MDPVKVEGIANWPIPTSIWQLCSFLGFCNFITNLFYNMLILHDLLTNFYQKWPPGIGTLNVIPPSTISRNASLTFLFCSSLMMQNLSRLKLMHPSSPILFSSPHSLVGVCRTEPDSTGLHRTDQTHPNLCLICNESTGLNQTSAEISW